MLHSIRSPTKLGPLGEPMAHAVQACVHCGFCLAACPTYQELGQEMDTPRGRIVLMKQVLEGTLPLGGGAAARRPLPRLPRVRTGVSQRRAVSRSDQPVSRGGAGDTSSARRAKGCGACWRRRPSRFPARFRLALAAGGLGKLLRPLVPGVLRPMLDLVPDSPAARAALARGDASARRAPRTRGACSPVARSRCSIRTSTPRRSRCSRAMAWRSSCRSSRDAAAGWRGTRATCAPRRPSRGGISMRFPPTWTRSSPMPPAAAPRCTSITSSCAGTPDEARAEAFRKRVVDVSVFLTRLGLREVPCELQVATQRIAYHDACHLANAQDVRREPRDLLRAIPGVELRELADAHLCCGSAGTYNHGSAGDRRFARRAEGARGDRHRRRRGGDRQHRLPHATAHASGAARLALAGPPHHAGAAQLEA